MLPNILPDTKLGRQAQRSRDVAGRARGGQGGVAPGGMPRQLETGESPARNSDAAARGLTTFPCNDRF
jgi:hypothetical protein